METIVGIITAVIIIFLSQVLSKYFTTKLFAATILVAIAFYLCGLFMERKPNKFGYLRSRRSVDLLFFSDYRLHKKHVVDSLRHSASWYLGYPLSQGLACSNGNTWLLSDLLLYCRYH